jgi:hypothetical protein
MEQPGEKGTDMTLRNEFASVRVERNDDGNGPRLLIEDLKSGRQRYLDPLQLETLVWIPDEEWKGFLDPSSSRWRAPVPMTGDEET